MILLLVTTLALAIGAGLILGIVAAMAVGMMRWLNRRQEIKDRPARSGRR